MTDDIKTTTEEEAKEKAKDIVVEEKDELKEKVSDNPLGLE